MYSYFSNNLPKYFNNYFTLKNIHSHDTCSASKINVYVDYKRTNYGKFSLKYRGTHIWNNYKSLQGYNSFKRSANSVKGLCVKSKYLRLLGF